MEPLAIPPAFGDEGIPVVFTGDEQYAMLAGVAIENLMALAAKSRKYDILILTMGVSREIEEAVTAQAAGRANISVRFFDLTDTAAPYRLDAMPSVKRFPPEVMLPVFIPLVCRNYPKVLALDVDIAILSDVAELFDLDLQDGLVGAVADFECTMEVMLHPDGRPPYREYIWKRLHVNPLEFFNSGVLLFNVSRILSENRLEDFTAAIPMIYRLPDQDVLNYACKGRVTFLPPVWNVQGFAYSAPKFERLPQKTREIFFSIREKTKIMHYTFVLKPWFYEDCIYWWKYAGQTPFYERIVMNYLKNKKVNPFLKERKKPKKRIAIIFKGK